MKIRNLFVAAVLLIGTVAAFGNEAKIRTHSINSGGGRSEGARTVIVGTIGAPIAGFSSAGNVSLVAGFPATLEIVLPEPDESFTNWMFSLPSPHRPPVGQRGPSDEPAGDGVSNLLKYAFGLMPMTPSADAKPQIVLVPFTESGSQTEKHYLALEFKCSTDAAVAFEIEHDEALSDWQSASFSTETIGGIDGDGRQQWRLTTDLIAEDHGKQFLRLIVIAQ